MSKETLEHNLKHPKDPGSAITHFIGVVMVLLAALPLLVRAATKPHPVYLVSLTIFAASMFLLYLASTTYHTFNISAHSNHLLKKFDHMMIYVLIAGSYTPICLIALHDASGMLLFVLVWGVALIGILQCIFWIDCPKWISSCIYITMGWLCIFSFSDIVHALSPAAFGWLLTGGIIYTIGGVIYAMKLPLFNKLHKNFGSHEIFHLFCLGGSLCHFVLMYLFVVEMPIL